MVTGPDIRQQKGCRTPKDHVQIFCISDEPHDRNDLAAAQADVVEELSNKLIVFRRSKRPGAMPAAVEPPAGFRLPSIWRSHSVDWFST